MKKRMITCGYILIVLAMLLPNIGVPLGESGIELAEAAGTGIPASELDGEATTEPSPEPTSTEGEPATPTATSTPNATLNLPTEPNPTASPTIELPLTQPPLLTATITATETPAITPLIPTETTIVLPTETPPMPATGTPTATLEIPTYTPTLLPSETPPYTNTIPIPIEGGEIIALDGMLKVVFPPGALPEPVYVYAGAPYYDQLPDSLSGNPFEITAFSQLSGQEVKQFLQPITIEVRYDENRWQERAGSLSLYYYDEERGSWRTIPSTLDTETKILIAETDHLTGFDINAWDWQAASLPSLSGFQVAQFTGAATYSYPMWVPSGPGGLQPGLALSYSSQTVDGSAEQTQASWVGMGWSLDVGYIERNMHGTMDTTADDTFSISAGGVSGQLLMGEDGYYHTTDESFWRIQYNNDIWEVWDKNGTKYTFGDTSNNSRAQFPDFRNSSYCSQYPGDAVQTTWWWGLVEVENIYGKVLTYTYTKETEEKYNPECENTNTHNTDIAIYPETITYPNNQYVISFTLGTRTDYLDEWADEDTRMFYQKSYLEKVTILNAEQVVKEYHLSYANDPEDSIFPGYDWEKDTHTLTLVGVQEQASDETTLPAMTFAYEDNLHLTEASNSYGGSVVFDYEDEAWHDIETSEDKDRPAAWSCIDETPTPWEGTNIHCTNSTYFTVRSNGSAYYDEVTAPFIQPGGVYKLVVHALAEDHTVQAEIGIIYDGSSSSGNSIGMTYTVPVTYSYQELTQYITLPSDTERLLIYIKNNSSTGILRVKENNESTGVHLYRMPTYYRVKSQTLHDEVTDQDLVTRYRYDDAATNDAEHSDAVALYLSDKEQYDLYGDQYGEYRGNAMQQMIAPDGRTTTTWFSQSDLLRGMAQLSIVHTQVYSQAFEETVWSAYSDEWTYTGTQPTFERSSGDNAAKVSNSATDWNMVFKRSEYALSDGQAVLVQFKVADNATQAVIGIESEVGSIYHRWGVKYVDPYLYVQECTADNENYYCSNSATLLTSLMTDTWYILELVVDDSNQFQVRAWQRDELVDPRNPQDRHYGEYQASLSSYTGRNWKFLTKVNNGSLWLDEYSEGSLYSQAESVYASVGITLTEEVSYTDLGINWSYNITQTERTYAGSGNWVGTQSESSYLEVYQNSHQYGNLTNTTTAYWNGSDWVKYRAMLARYYPNDAGGEYLVGLPASQNQFTCAGGVCNFITGYLIASTWYLYDDANTFSSTPVTGTLTGQRTLVCFADNNNVCYDGWNESQTRRIYSDKAFVYDEWGNLTQTKQYSGYGWASDTQSVLATEGEQVITTTYDPNYHTYPAIVADPLGNTTSWAYNLDFGVPISVTDANGASSYAGYDVFGRPVTITLPGDDRVITPTIILAYHDTDIPFWTEAQQRVEGSTYAKVRKIYSGLGQLLQTQTAGAELADGICDEVGGHPDICDVLVDFAYDASGRQSKTTVPYGVSLWDSYGTPYRTPNFDDNQRNYTETEYDEWGRTERVIGTTEAITQTFTYNQGYAGNLPYFETCTQNANGSQNCTQSDVWGRTIQVIPKDEMGNVISPTLAYEYDTIGHPTTVTTTNETHVDLLYDLAGRKLSMSDPDMGDWSYSYDALSRLQSQDDAKDQRTCLYYDLLNRPLGKYYTTNTSSCPSNPSLDVSYSYDGILFSDDFSNGLSGTDWATNGSVSVTNEQLQVVGDTSWNDWATRTGTLQDGQAVRFQFKASESDAVAGMFLKTGASGQTDYRRWGFYLSGNKIKRQYYEGTSHTETDLMNLEADEWYQGYILVDGSDSFRVGIWKISDPSKRGENVMTFSYDDWGNREWTFNLPVNTRTIYLDNYQEYDSGAIGKRSGMDVSGSNSTAWEYDLRGRVTEETRSFGAEGTFVTQWGYNPANQIAWMKYPLGNGGLLGEQIVYGYHPQVALTSLNSVDYATLYLQTASYDAAGRMQTITLQANNIASSAVLTTTLQYYPWDEQGGRLMEKTSGIEGNEDSLQALAYSYDLVGNITSITDTVNTLTSTFTYDELNRLLSGGGQTYTYDEQGRLEQKGNNTYYFEDTAHQNAVTHLNGTGTNNQKYWYDANGNVITRKAGGYTYDLSYSAENYLVEVQKDSSVIAEYEYDGDGRRVKSVQGNYTTYYIGNYYEYTQRTAGISNLTITPRGYGIACQDGATGNGYILYSAESVHTRFADNAPEIHNANHFICVIYDGENWKYDNDTAYYTFTPRETDILVATANFNNDSVVLLAGAEPGIVMNGIIYGYASGNMTITANKWNGQNNTGEFELGNNYIVPNQMVTVSKYYYAGAMRIAVRKLSIVSYLQVDELYYLFGDRLGSTSVSYLVGGTNTDYQTYKPWGEVLTAGSLPTKYTFTGQYSEVDAFGLIYFNARWYDPYLSRWIQADSIIPDIYNLVDWDHYSYARNNPVRFIDPSGHCSGDPDDPNNPDAKCWQWIETITNEFNNIWIDPQNWIAEELEAVWQALIDHVFLPEIRSASQISLFRRSVYIEDGIAYGQVGGSTTGDNNIGYDVTLYDFAYFALPGANGIAQDPSIDNFRGVVAHEFAHVGISQDPTIKDSYLDQRNLRDRNFSTLGSSYNWIGAADPTAERIAISVAAWEVDMKLFTDHLLWISWTDWQYSWSASYAHRNFCPVPIP